MTWKEKLFTAAIAALAAFLGSFGGGFGKPQPVAPPIVAPDQKPTPPAPPTPQAEVERTIGRIVVGSSGCTASLVGQKRVDRRYNILTAAHCVDRVGDRGTYTTQDGRRLTFSITAIDKRCDCAWGLTEPTDETFAFGEVADRHADVGDEVWHAGYGIDKPGNREVGTVVSTPLSDGKVQYNLNVSSGDSGGAIVHTKTGKILSVVCCAQRGGGVRPTWGASPECITALRRTFLDDANWTPVPLPERHEPAEETGKKD